MKKGQALLISSILLMNVLFLLPPLVFPPAQALNISKEMNLINAHVTITMDKEFGSMAILGDVNGDGFDDIMIGVGSDSNNFGKTYIFFGKSSGWDKNIDNSNADASFIGENQNDYAGDRVTGVGDVNGDGYCDLLVRAGRYNNGQDQYVGKVYLILGKKSGWRKDVSLSTADASFIGVKANDYVGSGIAGGGDVNGDGYGDFLISTTAGNGTIYVIFGRASGWKQNLLLSNADASFTGETGGDQAGRSLSCNGDMNGDKYDDILFGARQNEDGGNIGGTPAGKSYVVFGKPFGWQQGTNLATANASWIGVKRNEASGCSVAFVGDVNGDGYDDGLIGADHHEDRDQDTGRIGKSYLIFGKPDGWIKDGDTSDAEASFEGTTRYDQAGNSVSKAGDVNGDGYSDLLIGGPYNREKETYSGISFLLLGKASGWLKDSSLENAEASFRGIIEWERAGYFTSGGGDLNGDGYDDILIGGTKKRCFLIFPDSNSIPSDISSVTAFSDPSFSLETLAVEENDKVFIELSGTDTNASRRDVARVNITSSQYPRSIELRLIESGVNTGKYRGNFTIANRTHERYRWINGTEGGWIQITSHKNPTKFVNLTIGQRIIIEPKLKTVYTLEDSFYTQQFEATEILPDTWSFQTNASWLGWEPTTREIYGTPDNSYVGNYWVELKAEAVDANGLLNFTIQVNNTAPSITIPNVLKAHEAQEYSVDYDCTDDGQGTVTWHLDTTATWLNLDTFFGILNGTPGTADVGIHTVNISVDDGNSGWDFTEYELEVIEINDPPELLSYKVIPNDIYRGQSSVIYIEASDPENGTEMNPPLLEAKSEISPWFNIDCPYNFAGDNFTGIFETNSSSEKEKYSFRVKLTDKFNISGNWHYFNDTLSVMNNPPVFNESFTNLTAYSDQTTIIGLASYGTDYEDSGSELTWEVEEYSPKALFDAYMKDKNRVEISPASADKTGLGKIKFKITDNDDDVNYKNITIEIINASARPDITIELSSPGNETIIPNSTTNLTWSVGDFDGKLSYDIYFGDSLSNMTRISENNDEQMFKVTDLQDATTYYWKVIAKVEEIPGIYESGIYNFEVQFGFIEEHRVEINFKVDSVEVERGDSVVVDLTLKNLGNVPEIINLDVIGDLADSVSNDDTVQLGVGENKTISVRIFGGLKMELKTYNLTIRASFNGVEHKVYLDVEVVEDTSSVTIDNRSKAWILYLIAVILFLTIIAILILVIRRSKKKKEEDAETIEAEIEGRSSGITKADLDILAIGDTPPAVAPFQGRLSYNLPGQQQQPYQHKPLAPAPKVTLPQLKVTGAVKEQPKALPQSTGVPPTQPVSTPVPTVALPQKPGEEKKTSEVPALPMVGSAPTVPITPSVTVIPPTPLVVPAPSEPAAPPPPSMEPPLPPPAPFAPDESGIKLSHDSVKNASTFRIDEPMPCSICYGEISGGLQAARCSCGNISHLSCGIKIGKCSDCGVDYQGMINTVSQEAIVKSVEDSQKTAKREVEVSVEWDEKGDMMRGLLKQLLNKEISVEQYQQISKDIKESF